MRVIYLSKPCMLCFHGFFMHSVTPNSITPYFFIVHHKRLHEASLSHFHSVFISFQIPYFLVNQKIHFLFLHSMIFHIEYDE